MVRLLVLVLTVVVLQLAVVGQVNLFDANADLLPLVALSIGLLAGPVAGATVGFLLGLVADMALLQTLGVTSLLLIGVGYLAGRYRELRDATHKLVPPDRRAGGHAGLCGGVLAGPVPARRRVSGEPAGDPGDRGRRAPERAADRFPCSPPCARSCART